MRARTERGRARTRRGRHGGGARRTLPIGRGHGGLALAGALLLAGGTGHVSLAHAAGAVVGSGTAASCTTNDATNPQDGPHGLTAAVAGGGTVTFDCGGDPVTITDNLTISQNTTLDGSGQQVTLDGGGNGSVITVNSGMRLALTDLTIAHGASLDGGGIFNLGAVTLTNSTVSGNSVGVSGASGAGAGIFNNGTVTLTNSTVSGNSTGFQGGGGGIFNNDGGTVTLTNSTVSGNSTGLDNSVTGGGGIDNLGTVTLTNSTVSGNSAPDGVGGGIFNEGGTVTLRNTILAGNSASTDPDCSGTLTSDDYNLIQDTTGCAIVGTTTHDITGQDPHLGPLANNGGPTQTMADDTPATVTHPAVDAGSCVDQNGTAISTDQRGYTRPDDGEAACDIGAYESGASAPVPPPPPGTATPELGSGELLATGLLPLGAVLLYRRRRLRRAAQQ